MKPRKCKRHKINYQRLIFMVSLVMIYAVFTLFLKSMPVSYAWFTADTSSKGQILNATTSDLIQIIPEKMTYETNRTVNAELSIRNISNIDIPLKIELIVKNQILDTSSILLYQNDTFTTGWEKIEHIPEDTEDIQFRVIGFKGYINEVITYHVEAEKVQSVIPAVDADNQIKNNEEKQKIDASNQPLASENNN